MRQVLFPAVLLTLLALACGNEPVGANPPGGTGGTGGTGGSGGGTGGGGGSGGTGGGSGGGFGGEGGGFGCEDARRDVNGMCRDPAGNRVPDECCGPRPCEDPNQCPDGFSCEVVCFCDTDPPSCCEPTCVPDLPRCEDRGPATCGMDGQCRWLSPGCGDPAIEREGCFPAGDCRPGRCPEGQLCSGVWVDPCPLGQGCDACGVLVQICEAPNGCAGAWVGPGGFCYGPADERLPESCCTYNCEPGETHCKVMPPVCNPGEIPSVHDGCWGPCVATELCRDAPDEEALCRRSGGAWDPGGCGHSVCGERRDCAMPEPGCICGPQQIFDPRAGCVFSEQCVSSGDPQLCVQTGGIWDENACGHARCGLPSGCEAVIPGCNCGFGATFEPGRGCVVSVECWAGEGEACGERVGRLCLPGLTCEREVCRR